MSQPAKHNPDGSISDTYVRWLYIELGDIVERQPEAITGNEGLAEGTALARAMLIEKIESWQKAGDSDPKSLADSILTTVFKGWQ